MLRTSFAHEPEPKKKKGRAEGEETGLRSSNTEPMAKRASIDLLRGHKNMLAHRSMQRGALGICATAGSLGRRATRMESKIDQRMRIGNSHTYMLIATFLHARNPPAPLSLTLSRNAPLRDPPLQLSTLSPSTGRRRNPQTHSAHRPLSRQISEHLGDMKDDIAEFSG